ncbi:dihydropteroate synthase [Desulfogranum japonicum]|uniref:dihydropteroate synthase n=1 Tax=Desulfogranum japonicum TaxID=231447 RepID=UPI000408A431|nr:dihydropteroate synthase [Desulfogranum japonicum]
MGIVNVTPDSFSDGGKFVHQEDLAEQVVQLLEDGADCIDIGGESTRPFAASVSLEEELRRTIPAVQLVRSLTDKPISIDTTKAEVARQALDAGADIINDISALRGDPHMAGIAADSGCPVILMHMQGTPQNMQLQPKYNDVIDEINTFFHEQIAEVQGKGVELQQIILDPGLGFGKLPEHNAAILRNIKRFRVHGCPLLIGHSRKSFFDHLFHIPLEERDWPTAIVSLLCAQRQVDYVRVHDVAKTRLALEMLEQF